MNRRSWTLAALGASLPFLAGGLTACASSAPPLRWYRLPTERPEGEEAPPPLSPSAPTSAPASASPSGPRSTRPPAAGARVWELASTLPMPELLERDTLLVEEGTAGIRLLHGHRWAEPLRDALPRLLRHDLGLWLPGLWPTPAPPNLVVAGRVQVELLALQGSLPRRQVVAAARWVVTPGAGAGADAAPRAQQAQEVVPWTDGAAESLVIAQRVAMWRLARRIAASLQAA